MQPSEYWQNFELGTELDIAFGFVYDGLEHLHRMSSFEHESEVFSVLYNLSVGVERLLKIALILLEYDSSADVEVFEESLISHNHLELLKRVQQSRDLSLGKPHKEFMALLGKFYKSDRYDRYSITTLQNLSKEKKALNETRFSTL